MIAQRPGNVFGFEDHSNARNDFEGDAVHVGFFVVHKGHIGELVEGGMQLVRGRFFVHVHVHGISCTSPPEEVIGTRYPLRISGYTVVRWQISYNHRLIEVIS